MSLYSSLGVVRYKVGLISISYTQFSIGDKDIDLEFWGRKEKVDGIYSVGCQE